jgi:hypothetical protein
MVLIGNTWCQFPMPWTTSTSSWLIIMIGKPVCIYEWLLPIYKPQYALGDSFLKLDLVLPDVLLESFNGLSVSVCFQSFPGGEVMSERIFPSHSHSKMMHQRIPKGPGGQSVQLIIQ